MTKRSFLGIILVMEKLKKFLFGEQSLRQTLFKNSFWFTVSNAGSNVIKLIVVIYAARIIGAAQYGLFSYAMSVAGILGVVGDLGMSYLITINLARRDENQEYFSTLMILRLGLVASIVIFAIAVGPLITKFPDAIALIPFVALLIASDDIRGIFTNFARAENRIDKEAFGHIIASILIAAFSIIGLAYSPTSYTLALTYFAGSALGTLAMFFVVRWDVKKVFRPLKFSFSLAKSILAVAIPFGLASIMWPIMTNTDALVIGWFRTASELGYYAAAQRPIAIVSLLPSILVVSSLTLIARLAKEGAKERLKNFIERLTTFSLAIILPLAAGGIIIAPSIIRFLYGTEYMPAILSFQLLLVTLVISFPGNIVTNIVLAFKRTGVFTVAMILGALGNFIFDILLIPPFGIAGSVVATIVSLGIINCYMLYNVKKLQPFETLRFLPRIVIATILMGLVTLALHLTSVNFVANIIISAAVYLGVLIVAREPLLKDLRELFRFQG